MQVGPEGKGLIELMPVTAEDKQKKRGSRSVLQVWLGSSQGWSLPVELFTNPSSQVAHPPLFSPGPLPLPLLAT